MVFAHSLTLHGQMWKVVAQQLSQTHRCFIVDVHGHGQSEGPHEDRTLEQLADDLVRVLDALSLDRVTWVGHSMGGMLGQRIALRHPERITALALCNTSGQAEDEYVRDMYHKVNEKSRGKPTNEMTVNFVLSLMFRDEFREASPEAVEPFYKLMRYPPDAEAVYFVAKAVIWRTDLREQLPSIAVPTLIITSEQDVSAPTAHGVTLESLIPNARRVHLQACGHVSPVERPDAVTAALRELLA